MAQARQQRSRPLMKSARSEEKASKAADILDARGVETFTVRIQQHAASEQRETGPGAFFANGEDVVQRATFRRAYTQPATARSRTTKPERLAGGRRVNGSLEAANAVSEQSRPAVITRIKRISASRTHTQSSERHSADIQGRTHNTQGRARASARRIRADRAAWGLLYTSSSARRVAEYASAYYCTRQTGKNAPSRQPCDGTHARLFTGEM